MIVITGGSRGIGAATALIAAKRGYSVCVNYRKDEAAAARIVGEIEASGGTAFAVRADVSREEEVVDPARWRLIRLRTFAVWPV